MVLYSMESHHFCLCPSGDTAHSLRTSALEEGFIGNKYIFKNYQFLIKAETWKIKEVITRVITHRFQLHYRANKHIILQCILWTYLHVNSFGYH